MTKQDRTGNRQQATGNFDGRLTGNRQQATGNGQLERRELKLGADIAGRLLEFAVEVLLVVKMLPRDTAGKHVAGQLARASTACGANYEEARAAESREDFIHKLGIAAKEVREAMFWVRLAERSAMISIDVSPLVSEALQLAAILAASIRTARLKLET
jgi:four helix bundle protein